MPMYTFHLCHADGHLCHADGGSPSFEAFELPGDGAIFAYAERLLGQHRSCDHVEVWEGERAVLALHREQPVFRPVRESQVHVQC